MENKGAYYSAMLTAGVIIGLVSVAPAYVNWIVGKVVLGPYISIAIQTGILVFAFLTYGKKAAELADTGNGYSHARAWGFTVLASLVAGFVASIFSILLMHFLAPEIRQETINTALSHPSIASAPKEAIKIQIKIWEYATSVVGIMIMNVISMLFFGGLVGLFTSLRTRRFPQI